MHTYDQAAVMDDVEEDAFALKSEFEKRSLPTEVCFSEEDLLKFLATVESALVVVDIDMGHGRRRGGINAIEKIKALQKEAGSNYYVAALTSHSELKRDAASAGADAFVTKLTPVTDALELMTRASAHSIERESRRAQEMQAELAKREYKSLVRQLRALNVANSVSRIETASETVGRALGWPFLLPSEQMVLSTLDEELRVAIQREELSSAVLDIWLEGAIMLERSRATEGSIRDWLQRLTGQSSRAVFRWVSDD